MNIFKTSMVVIAIAVGGTAYAQDSDMSFFITSTNPGHGADLGGLAGADAYCTSLAEAAGVTGKTWAAYLSSSAENARDRIGSGPWMNAKGVVVAESVSQLHSEENNLSKETSLSEAGDIINGRGDAPNRHSAHGSRGCSLENLRGTGGDGLFYCFAVN